MLTKQGVLFYTGIHSATHFINSFRMTSKNVTVSRAVPYDMSSVGDYDVIVVEIVERNIKNLLEYSEQ